jgi:hypothetical protein
MQHQYLWSRNNAGSRANRNEYFNNKFAGKIVGLRGFLAGHSCDGCQTRDIL